MDIYYKKYIKYKTKYLELKKQIGGDCADYDNPHDINSVIHEGTIGYLEVNYYVIYHAYKHMDTLGQPCNWDGMVFINDKIDKIFSNEDHKKTLEQIKSTGTPGKLLQSIEGGQYMYIMVSFDSKKNSYRVFQVFKSNNLGQPIDIKTYAEKARDSARERFAKFNLKNW